MSARRSPLIARASMIAFVALGACEPSSNEFAPPPPPRVTVATPVMEDVTDTIEAPARAEAQATVEIRARVSGYLEEAAFEAGAVVERGALLFQIEREPYIAKRDAVAAQVARLEASLALAETRLTRAERAFERDAVSDIEIIQARAERDQAAAEVAAAEADLAAAELELSYTTITAPMKGRLSRSLVDEGNLVGAGEKTLLTTMVDDGVIEVYFDVDERQLLRLLERQGGRRDRVRDSVRARIVLADGSAYPLEGLVDFGDNRINPQTGTLRVRAIVENPRGSLVDGMFCRVFVPVRTRRAMTIPEAAVSRDASGSFALVVGAGDVVERRRVSLGRRSGDRIVVLDGLSSEERIVVAGVQRARDGLPVSPTPADARSEREADAGS